MQSRQGHTVPNVPGLPYFPFTLERLSVEGVSERVSAISHCLWPSGVVLLDFFWVVVVQVQLIQNGLDRPAPAAAAVFSFLPDGPWRGGMARRAAPKKSGTYRDGSASTASSGPELTTFW
jgi:hypothetical protein